MKRLAFITSGAALACVLTGCGLSEYKVTGIDPTDSDCHAPAHIELELKNGWGTKKELCVTADEVKHASLNSVWTGRLK